MGELRTLVAAALLAAAAACGGSGGLVRITTEDPLPDGIVGAPYSFLFTAAGGTGHEWTGVDVPFGSVAENGSYSGVPERAGAHEIRVRVQAGAASDEWPFHFAVYDPLESILDDPPYLRGEDGVDVTTAVRGGKQPYACSWTEGPGAGELPPGVTLDEATCILAGEAAPEVPGSYGALVAVEDQLGQRVEIPVYYAVAPCANEAGTLEPEENPPRAVARGAESSWLVTLSDLDVPCLDATCAECQACYGISFPVASPLGPVPGLNCTGAAGVCYECAGCIDMDGACPGAGSMAPTLRIAAHDPIREGPAWVSFSVLIQYTGDDAAHCTGKGWQCHVATLEI
jgi:hypothetical protein